MESREQTYEEMAQVLQEIAGLRILWKYLPPRIQERITRINALNTQPNQGCTTTQ